MVRNTRAFVLESLGYDGLRLRTRAVPEPQSGQVLVRMKAASINYRDLKILKGVYARNPRLPVILLSDGAGEVVEVGPGVSGCRAGDRVLPVYMEGWYQGPMTKERAGWKSKGGDVDGMATEFRVCNANEVVTIPETLGWEEAACLPCAAVTAWHGLVYSGRVKAGDTILTMGSGGVSLAALQIARMSGAEIIATSSDDDKLARMTTMGAHHGINYRKVPDWGRAARALTRGRGVDIVVELGGETTIGQSVVATRDGGYIASIGNLSGAFCAPGVPERGITVESIVVGSREMLADLLRALALHEVRPVIDRAFAFHDLKEALAYLESGRHFGKIVLSF